MDPPDDTTPFLKVDQVAIGDDCYAHSTRAPQWQKVAGHCSWISSDWVLSNPVALLDQIQRPGSVTYQGRIGHGATAVDRWAVGYTWPVDPRGGRKNKNSYTGTVDVKVATGRVSTVRFRLVTAILEPGQTSASPDSFTSAVDVVGEYSDYGAPVVVTAPREYVAAPSPEPSPTG
jgi:hypothetical protein